MCNPAAVAVKLGKSLVVANSGNCLNYGAELGMFLVAVRDELPSNNPVASCVPCALCGQHPITHGREALMHLRSVGGLLIVLLLSPICALPQNNSPVTGQPKIGLVLEGGGALGLAHIGVLEWLEEHHIPVSYISGTSMGGLIGGVYAVGYNSTEARDLIKSINWDQVLAGQIP